MLKNSFDHDELSLDHLEDDDDPEWDDLGDNDLEEDWDDLDEDDDDLSDLEDFDD